MVLKQMDSKDNQIAELERLITIAPEDRKAKIEQELRSLRAGIKAEKEAAYLIDFEFKASPRTLIIHDLRLEVDNRVAQIDHLLIHRTLNIFVLETKYFHSRIRINEMGEFLRWNNFTKSHEGIASPIAQNERHLAVLTDAFHKIDMPSRMGMMLSPVFHSIILINTKTRIDRPKGFDTRQVVKADMIRKTVEDSLQNSGFLKGIGNLSRVVPSEGIKKIGHSLLSLHKPVHFNYAAKFGLTENAIPYKHLRGLPSVSKADGLVTTPSVPVPNCQICGSENISIQYGKAGYYIRCNSCDGATPIMISCGKNGHKERVRKDGCNFYRECPDCKTSSLFFVNPKFSAKK